MRVTGILLKTGYTGDLRAVEATFGLDNVDEPMLSQIVTKFCETPYEQRKELYDKIMKL